MLCFVALLSAATPLVAQRIEVEPVWLARNCLDRGTADKPLSGPAFEACLNKKVEGLPPLDKTKRELFGERYDPAQYVKCRLRPNGRNNSACEVFVLRRREWPQAVPIEIQTPQWPNQPSIEIYKPGLSAEEYWAALCKSQSGDTVFETASGVKGIFNARPRERHTDLELRDRYVLEDPYSISDILGDPKLESVFVQPYGGRYEFLETYRVIDARVRRFERDEASASRARFHTALNKKYVVVPYIVAQKDSNSIASRYGISWRGIRRSRDRENAIAGVEVVIFELRTGKLLAIRRGFALSGHERKSPSGIWWISARRCPDDRSKSLRQLVYEVLQPIPNINAAIRPISHD
jgi:hypothetical protein